MEKGFEINTIGLKRPSVGIMQNFANRYLQKFLENIFRFKDTYTKVTYFFSTVPKVFSFEDS